MEIFEHLIDRLTADWAPDLEFFDEGRHMEKEELEDIRLLMQRSAIEIELMQSALRKAINFLYAQQHMAKRAGAPRPDMEALAAELCNAEWGHSFSLFAHNEMYPLKDIRPEPHQMKENGEAGHE